MAVEKKELTKGIVKRFIEICFFLIIQAIIFFVAAGRLNLPRAWYFFALSFVYMLISAPIVVKLNPEVVKERGETHKGTKFWDYVFGVLYTLSLFAMSLVAGLDIGRFEWSSMGIPFLLFGTVLLIAGNMFSQWAIVVNKHFEKTVRIQEERHHQVVSTGPYAIVRHPGYVGMIISNLATPLILGSLYTLIPFGVLAILFVIRTALEDKTLQKELAGYSEYAQKTRYRLIPGVW